MSPDAATLRDFQTTVMPPPGRVLAAIDRGVRHDGAFGLDQAPALLEADELPFEDGVLRNPDGTLVVRTRSDLPGVTPAMVDWWFSWHLPQSERYRLWHPEAHIAAATTRDPSGRADMPGAYVGSTSQVRERIGRRVMRLSITFVSPETLGLTADRLASAGNALAVCGCTGLPSPPIETGHLIHVVREVPGGSEMRSSFWLGEVQARLPIVSPVVGWVANRPAVRRRAVSDALGLALLRHCSEEMHHFARFLPHLYAGMHEPARESTR